MKLIVIGLGSMGKRRIRLLLKEFSGIIVCGVDLNQERRVQVECEFNIRTYSYLTNAIDNEKPDAVFVCTSPISHADIALESIGKGLHVFSEINLLCNKYDEIIQMAKLHDVQIFLSSTLLYRKEIQEIKQNVLCESSRVNYRYHVGQYLPDWHPWEDYRNFFVANKKTNGCREILAIDLPWIIDIFGKIKKIYCLKDKMSGLEIDYPDNYIIMLEHENGNKGTLNIDIVSRKAVRDLLVYSENLYITWDGTPNGILKYNLANKSMDKISVYDNVQKDYRYADNIIENAYLEEIKVFIEKINNRGNGEKYTFEEDKYTLSIIDQIEGG